MGYNRQLTFEEEKYEENVSTAGEAFMMQMQDASEFVNTQTPLMTKLLEDTFQVCQALKIINISLLSILLRFLLSFRVSIVPFLLLRAYTCILRY